MVKCSEKYSKQFVNYLSFGSFVMFIFFILKLVGTLRLQVI